MQFCNENEVKRERKEIIHILDWNYRHFSISQGHLIGILVVDMDVNVNVDVDGQIVSDPFSVYTLIETVAIV